MTEHTRIAILYGVFAAIAAAANIGCQSLITWLYVGQYTVPISILFGTVVGMPIKYELEKHYIFKFKAESLTHEGSVFTTYSLMGVVTTALFWGIEYAFHIIFEMDVMRYLGGLVGLTLGYLIKYQLDKRFVFVGRNVLNVGAA